MSLPEETSPPSIDPNPTSRARRRRQQRRMHPLDSVGRAALLEQLSRRSYPSYEFFLFALTSGAILGLAYILDSQALLFFGILLAPLMTPWVGMTLAAVTGSFRFFFHTLAALLVNALLIFIAGLLAGFAARIWMPLPLTRALADSRLWWPSLLVLAVGAIVLNISFVRSEDKPILPSAMLAYGLFLPLSAAAFGLGSGAEGIWPQGLLVFLVYFAWAGLFGVATLALLGFRPRSFLGYAFSGIILVIGVGVLLVLSGMGGSLPAQIPALNATSTPTASVGTQGTAPGPLQYTPIPTQTVVAAISSTPTPKRTPTFSIPPSSTPTTTITPLPTPVYARIFSKDFGGAIIREKPGGPVVMSLSNDYLVQVLPDVQQYKGSIWVHVSASLPDGREIEGWILQDVLVTATPIPNW